MQDNIILLDNMILLEIDPMHVISCDLPLSGVGAKRGRDEDWIQHQDTFDEILAGLNEKQVESRQDPEATKDDKKKTLVENAKESKRLV